MLICSNQNYQPHAEQNPHERRPGLPDNLPDCCLPYCSGLHISLSRHRIFLMKPLTRLGASLFLKMPRKLFHIFYLCSLNAFTGIGERGHGAFK
jgi:hypothetical protein